MCGICGGYMSSLCPECGFHDDDNEPDEPEYNPEDDDPDCI